MAAEQDDVLSILSENGGDSDFSGFEETEMLPKKVDAVTSKKRKQSIVKDKNKTKKSEKTSVSFKTQTSGSSSANGAAIQDTANASSHVTSMQTGTSGSSEKASTSKKNTSSKGKSASNVSKGKAIQKKSNSFDISDLSETDISMLRNILGISDSSHFQGGEMDEEDFPYLFADNIENLPKVHVEVENEPCSDTEIILPEDEQVEQGNNRPYSSHRVNRTVRPPLSDIGNQLSAALFDSVTQESSESLCDDHDDDSWQLPKLKAPQRGEAISSSLASLINTACTAQCVTDELVSKYKLPSNCDKLAPPLVNPEIWNDIAKKAQTYDRFLRDIQTLLATGMIPVIKLSKLLSSQISKNTDAKTLISDAIILLGQAQFNLSLRRRYMIRPFLKKKYSNLCSLNTPVTCSLFGDDVQKEIKKCDTSMTVAKDQYQNSYYSNYGNSYNQRFVRNRARGRGGPSRGSYPYSGYSRGHRYQPYPRNPGYAHLKQQFQAPRKSKKTIAEDASA